MTMVITDKADLQHFLKDSSQQMRVVSREEFLESKVSDTSERLNKSAALLLVLDFTKKENLKFISLIQLRPEYSGYPLVALVPADMEVDISDLYTRGINSVVALPPEKKEVAKVIEEVYRYWLNFNRYEAKDSSGARIINGENAIERLLVVSDDPVEANTILASIQGSRRIEDFRIIGNKDDLGQVLGEYDPEVVLAMKDSDDGNGQQPFYHRAPFIILCERMDPLSHAEWLKRGVHDCVFRYDIQRLQMSISLATQKKRAMREIEDTKVALMNTEERYRSLVENMTAGLVQVDMRDVILFCNPRFAQFLGYQREHLVGRSAKEFISDTDNNPVSIINLFSGANTSLELVLTNVNGDKVWVQAGFSPVNSLDGTLEGVIGIFTDIQKRRMVEEELRRSEERYAVAARGANDGLWDWNLQNHTIFFSDRWKFMLGYGGESISENEEEWLERIHPKDAEQFRLDLEAHLKGAHPFFRNEHRLLHRDGYYIWVQARGVAVRDESGNPVRIAGSISDITDKKVAEAQLQHDAFYDSLTGLPNKSLFQDRLRQAFVQYKSGYLDSLGVLYLDLDRFLVVNESLGHRAGDRLLVEMAKRITSLLQAGSTFARQNADEFLILVENMTRKEIAKLADSILRVISKEPYSIHGNTVYITASLGVAYGDYSYLRGEDLMRDAEIAMYHAKTGGKARVVFFDPEMRTPSTGTHLLKKESDLHRAIEENEFELYYQPIVSLKEKRITGVEALIRWNRPDNTIVSPLEFIPLAEETGLILPIGEWVLRTAVRQVQSWQKHLDFCPVVSVNISPRQFYDQNLLSLIQKLLKEMKVDPLYLKLEITETLAMKDLERSATIMEEIAAIGVKIAIDDFGTGYSSLSYLKRFPIHTLKIDQAFTRDLAEGTDDSAIIQAIIAMAHSLKLDVVAEGVETTQKRDILDGYHCDHIQGYYYSRPANAEAMFHLLQQDQ